MDIDYTIAAVWHSYRDRAMRAAVFGSILGRGWSRSGVADAYARARAAWRGALGRLQGEGWAPDLSRTGGDRAIQYMRNCPPFGVATATRALPCGQRLVCPHCWAKAYVAAPHDFLRSVLVAAGPAAADSAFAVRRLRRHFRVDPAAGRTPEVVVLKCLVAAARLIATRAYRGADLAPFPRHRGAVVIFTVEPVRDGVVFTRATVVLAAAAGPAGPTAIFPATGRGLAEALAGAVPYPRGLLTAPHTAIADLLQVLGGHRMLTCYKARD